MKVIEGSETTGISFEVELNVNDSSKQAMVRCDTLGILVTAGTARQALVKFANAIKMVKNKRILEALK